MSEKNETKKVKKKKHPIRTFLSLVAILVSCFMIWMAASDFITTMNLRKEITESESAISSLETQKEQLTDEKNKKQTEVCSCIQLEFFTFTSCF